MNLDVRLEELLPYPVEAVWDVLTDRAAISEWLMATPDFEARVGAHFTMKTEHLARDGWVRAEILELEGPRRMVWSWSADDRASTTKVTFELRAEADGTLLTLTHVGEIDPLVGRLLTEGWPGRIELVRRTLDRTRRHTA
jgi:uncharacterized protein YndB with AHSA1/START domain